MNFCVHVELYTVQRAFRSFIRKLEFFEQKTLCNLSIFGELTLPLSLNQNLA